MKETIAVGLVLPFGYLDDSIKGISHFAEHLLFNSNSVKYFLKTFDEKGILYNGITSYDYILFYCQGLKSDRQLMVDFCESILLNFEITEEEFEREKKIVLSEIEYYLQNKIEVVSNNLVGNKNSLAILGSRESISSITRLNIVEYIDNIKKIYSIVDSDGVVMTTKNRCKEQIIFSESKKNTIKLINNNDYTFNNYYGIGIRVSREVSKYFRVFIDKFLYNLNNEFREKKALTYRIHTCVVKTTEFVQHQFIFSIVNEGTYLDIIKSTEDILERTKKEVLNLCKEKRERYLERLETKTAIRLDNQLGRMKFHALENLYMQSNKENDILLEDDIDNLSLIIAVYNTNEIDITLEYKEFDVEIIHYG